MKPVCRILRREALNLGFEYVRDAKHGELWRHQLTGRVAMLARTSNLGGYQRGWTNQLKHLQHAARFA